MSGGRSPGADDGFMLDDVFGGVALADGDDGHGRGRDGGDLFHKTEHRTIVAHSVV